MGFLCLRRANVIKIQRAAGNILNLRHAPCRRQDLIQIRLGDNDQTEMQVKLFILDILGRRVRNNDFARLLDRLKHEERPCRLQDTGLLYLHRQPVHALALLDRLAKYALLTLVQLNSYKTAHRCLSSSLRLRRLCLPCRRAAVLGAVAHNIIQTLNQRTVIICTLVRALPDVRIILLQRVKTLEQHIDHIRFHFDIAVSHLGENIFHIMCQRLHSLIAHGSRHTLQGMGGTEDLIDRIHILRILLQRKDLRIQILQMFIGFIKENLKILAYIHIILPPRLS